MIEQAQKMNIEKDNNELKLYLFTVQNGPLFVEFPEDVKTVMAYTAQEATNIVRNNYPFGKVIRINKRASVVVRKIIDVVDVQPLVPQEVKMLVEPPQSKEKSVQDFVYGMLLIADQFVTDERDRAVLKQIVGKIKRGKS